MAQMVSRGGPLTAPTTVITVADLLHRNNPLPARSDMDETVPGVSVGSLLRREGHKAQADRPVGRSRQQPDKPAAPSARKQVKMRRTIAAAGTLLAAGSVFGAAVLTEVGPTGNSNPDTAEGTHPGDGLLDQNGDAIAAPGPAVVDPPEPTLDAGIAPPVSWVPVAFPSAVSGVPSGLGTVGVPAGGGGAGVSDAGGQATNTGGSNPGGGAGTTGGALTGEGDTTQGTPESGSDTSRAASDSRAPSSSDGESEESSGPVSDLVHGVGNTAGEVTDEVDDVTEPVVNTLAGESEARAARTDDGGDDRNDDSADNGDEESGGLLDTVGNLAKSLLG